MPPMMIPNSNTKSTGNTIAISTATAPARFEIDLRLSIASLLFSSDRQAIYDQCAGHPNLTRRVQDGREEWTIIGNNNGKHVTILHYGNVRTVERRRKGTCVGACSRLGDSDG